VTIVVMTGLEVLLRVGAILLFPAQALWAWRRGGAGRLWYVTGVGVGLSLLFAAFAASAAGGNVLAPVHGYRYIASGTLVLYGLTVGVPVVSAALVIRALGARWSARLGLYVVGVLGAALGWVAGVLAAAHVLLGSGQESRHGRLL